jgi:hypothetical protein
VLALVLRIRLVAVSLTVKCPLLFMTPFSKQLPSQYLGVVEADRAQLALMKALSCGSSRSTAFSL